MPRTDRLRAVIVLVCALLGFAIRFWPRISVRRVTHEISASGSRLAPSEGAFYLDWWLAIALVAYAVWQLRARQVRRPVHRRIGWFAPAIVAGDVAWPLVLASDWGAATRLAVAAALLLALVAMLVVVVYRINRSPDLKHVDLYLLDATFGLHLGWTTVLSASTLGALLLAAGVRPPWWLGDLAASAALLVVAGLVTWWCFLLGNRVAVALSAAWGLVWIAVERLLGTPHAVAVAVVAFVAALHCLGFTRWRRRNRGPRPGVRPAAA